MAETPWTATMDYGYPDMTTVDDAAWAPARRRAMEAQRARVETIAADTEPATVDNVLRAFAVSGVELERLQRAFGVVAAADGTESRQRVRSEAAPEIAAHSDWLTLHAGLFARLQELQARIGAGRTQATDEQRWFLEQLILRAAVAGADLPLRDQEKLKSINEQLARDEAAYSRLQVREAEESAVLIETAEELAGLSESQISSARAAARDAGHDSEIGRAHV